MKYLDKIGINIIDALTIDFSVLSDVVYTLKSIEFSSNGTIKWIHVQLNFNGNSSTVKLIVLLNNQWGGVTTKTVSYIYLGNDVYESIDFMVREYEEWYLKPMEEKMKLTFTKFPNIVKNGELTFPKYGIITALNKQNQL